MADADDHQSQRERARATRKAERFAAREGDILDAAADLLIRYGYDKMTMDDIATAAHVSKGALYLHFHGKSELIDALIRRETQRVLTDYAARLGGVPRMTLAELFRSSMLALGDNALMRALFNQDRRVLGDYARRAAKLPIVQQYSAFGAEFVRQFQAAGLIRRDISPDVIAHILMMLRYGLFVISDFAPQHRSPPLEAVADGLVALLETGFAANDEPEDAAARQMVEAMFAQAQRIVDELNRTGADRDR